MPKKCATIIAFMGLSAASVALHGSWYEPSKVPTQVNPYDYPSFKDLQRSFKVFLKGVPKRTFKRWGLYSRLRLLHPKSTPHPIILEGFY